MSADIPKHCPGPQSEFAGKENSCQGCPNQSICSTGTAAQKGSDSDIPMIEENLSEVKNIIVVLSGKGGVGKSTFTAQLGHWLSQREDCQVGVLDLDICGPSIPIMMGCSGENIHFSGSGWSPLFVKDNLAVMSVGFLLERDELAVIWRGPKKNGLIKQFLKDVDWGSLDYLIIDTPPGTSDEHISIAQLLKSCNVGAVIISTPQEVCLQDVRKEIDFCRKVNLPIVGIIENMGIFQCPNCNKSSQIYHPTTGGAKKMSEDLGLSFLGSLPLDPSIGKACDFGKPFFTDEDGQKLQKSKTVESFESVALNIIKAFEGIHENL